jgi:hypothetical protein
MFQCFTGINTGSYYSISTLLNQMLVNYYRVNITPKPELSRLELTVDTCVILG